jgi:hypothetical protein
MENYIRLQPLWLVCGVLQAEIAHLLARQQLPGRAIYLNSMLHMEPLKLDKVLVELLSTHRSPPGLGKSTAATAATGATLASHSTAATVTPTYIDCPLVLVYGDCCPQMYELSQLSLVCRVNAINCAQMLVGKARYRQLMAQEAFMLLPEWSRRWREIFEQELGLSPALGKEMLGEHRGRFGLFRYGFASHSPGGTGGLRGLFGPAVAYRALWFRHPPESIACNRGRLASPASPGQGHTS